MDGESELRGWLALILAPGVTWRALESLQIPPEEFPELAHRPRRRLRAAGLRPDWIDALAEPDAGRLDACLAWLEDEGHHLVAYTDSYYPPLLRRIPDPPPALFVNGRRECLLRPQVAIVGSRKATPGGLDTARDFAAGLSSAGFTVASGLALGIDGAAHAAALDAGGATVAVAGTGPDRVYPAHHRDLAHRIVADGAVVTQFTPGTGPRASHFPARNRILSGLSLGVLVVEAGEQSGSLITARCAGDQGREVFAVPGSIHNPVARGCHRLIRQGARLVESAAEVVDELGPLIGELEGELRGLLDPPGAPPEREKPAAPGGDAESDPEVARLLAALGHDPVSVDELIVRTNLTTQAVSSMLLELELQGRVASLGGGRYSRVANDQEGLQ